MAEQDCGSLPADVFVRRFAEDAAMQADPEARARHEHITRNASVCSYCGVGCPYTVVEGPGGRERLAPLSSLGLCVKGTSSLLTGGDHERPTRLRRKGLEDDRIRVPMIRGHDGKMMEVSWEQALDRAAWLFLHTREWVGPGNAGIYGNGQKTIEAIFTACLWKLVFDLPTVGANSEHCLASAGAAHELNFGNEAAFTWKEFEELEICDVAVLHGTNAFVTFPQAYEKLKRNTHAVKVVIDPVRSDTASDLEAADPRTLHIRFEQGGDILFNLAVARVILEEGWEDRAYLERVVEPESMEAFRELCFEERCAPRAVAEAIALEDDTPEELEAMIRRYAALLAKPGEDGERPRSAFVSSMGINQSTGSYGFSTNLNLLLLTGNVGRRGAGSLRIAGQSNATSELTMGFNSRRLMFNLDPENPEHRAELARVLDIPEKNIPARKGTPVCEMADDPMLYCFIFVGTQMTRNMPRLGHWMKRLGRSFNIVIDSFLGEGVLDYADVLLPALTYTERTGVIQRGDRTLQLQQQLSPPPEKAWSDTQILVRLALAIARRLRDPDTAALNDLDADAVHRAFARYTDEDGQVDTAGVFDHIVELSRELNLYCRLENEAGEPITHEMLRANAGVGVQWQGDGRYSDAREEGPVFPGLRHDQRHLAKMVRPPEDLMQRLVQRGDDKLRSLISGRGRPGRRARYYRGRYNSGIKTLPLTGREPADYRVEVHPAYAERSRLEQDDAVRMNSRHGAVIARVSLNARVPVEFPFVDFVPGEVNRLTDYIESDRFTNQSLIKRTPVRIEPLTAEEAALWEAPDRDAFLKVMDFLHDHYRAHYPTDEDWESFERGDDGAPDWLPLDGLREPENEAAAKLAAAVGAFSTFLQRYMNDAEYHDAAGELFASLSDAETARFMSLMLPFLRKLDYHQALHRLLSHVVGPIMVKDHDGSVRPLPLKEAHEAAVLELKEEIVANQLYVAIRRGLQLLYGEDAVVPRDDLAFVSGIAIPCAGDVPASVMGVPPSDLASNRLIHSRALGRHALMVVDRTSGRGVKLDIVTGVLPKDSELMKLRGAVITKKRQATPEQHDRFFDRLGELVAKFVRDGDDNYEIYGPMELPWEELVDTLSYAPATRMGFRRHLEQRGISEELVRALVALDVLDAQADAALIERLLEGSADPSLPSADTPRSRTLNDLLDDTTLSTFDKLRGVIKNYVEPVLENDGGQIEFIEFDEAAGDAVVRFVGSCANCPYSMLSMETLVKPALLSVPGVRRVVHRGRLRNGEMNKVTQIIESEREEAAEEAPAAPAATQCPVSGS